MRERHKDLLRLHKHAELFSALAHERRFKRFSRLHFAADKLPQHSVRFMRRTLRDQKTAFPPNQCRNNLKHNGSYSFF